MSDTAHPPEEVEEAARALAESFGYHFGVLTDGTIVLERPLDPNCCSTCAYVEAGG